MAVSDSVKIALFSKTTDILEFKDKKEFDTQKADDARKMGVAWMKEKLGESGHLCKTEDDFVKAFEVCGNGLDLYKKVYTVGTSIVVEK